MTENKLTLSVKTSPVSTTNMTIQTNGANNINKPYFRSQAANIIKNALKSKGGKTADRLKQKLVIKRLEILRAEAMNNISREIETADANE